MTLSPQAHLAGYCREYSSLQLSCGQTKVFGKKDSSHLPTCRHICLWAHQTHFTTSPTLLTAITKCTLLFLPQQVQEGWFSCAGYLHPQTAAPYLLQEAVVSQMKASPRPEAEPRSPRSILRALALIPGTKLPRELTSHSPTTGFATGTHLGQSHLIPSFPAPLSHTRTTDVSGLYT